MKRLAGLAVVAAVILGLVPVLPACASGSEDVPGRLLVVFDDAPGWIEVAGVHGAAGAEMVGRVPELGLDVVAVEDVGEAAEWYGARSDVEAVEVDARVHSAGTPDDPMFPLQWNLAPPDDENRGTANVGEAWPTAKGRKITVAVIDTGVRKGGADLDRNRVLRGKDYVDDDFRPLDLNGHGTHIAGTIAQSTNNSKGVAGVAPKVKVLPVRVLDAVGAGFYSDVIDGLLWAAERADVINLSLAGVTYSEAMCDAVAEASKTSVVVVSVGNSGTSIAWPAACPKALAVGAVRFDGKAATYSNRGRQMDFVAPGGDTELDQNDDGYEDGILQQTYDDGWGYRFYQGTSMAAAHVSGVAALVLDAWKDTPVKRFLRRTARDLGKGGHDRRYGYGAVDAASAVALADFRRRHST